MILDLDLDILSVRLSTHGVHQNIFSFDDAEGRF
jgi:hypothetical protein